MCCYYGILKIIFCSPKSADWFGVLVTLSAVAAALFQEKIRSLWDKPKLNIFIKLEPPDCVKTPFGNGGDGYQFRFIVENEGSQMANDAQVYLSGLSKRGPDGEFRPETSFLPMNFRWAHYTRKVYLNIAPKMGKHCNLGQIPNPAPGCKVVLHLALEVTPNTGRNELGPGCYRLFLKVAANNVGPIFKTFELTINSWVEDESKMFSEGISIKEISE